MTLESWNLIFSAATSGMVLVGGFYIHNLVNQQLATKDATIEFLKSAIGTHQAQIAALQGERAPAIVQDYKAMREHAEQVTQDKQKLDQQVKLLAEQQKERDKTGIAPDPIDVELAEAKGLVLAANIIVKRVSATTGTGAVPNKILVQAFFDSLRQISDEIQVRHKSAKSV